MSQNSLWNQVNQESMAVNQHKRATRLFYLNSKKAGQMLHSSAFDVKSTLQGKIAIWTDIFEIT